MPVNSAVAINLDGANARITMSSLTPDPSAATKPKSGPTTTYTASVTVVGVSGSFALDPESFTAHSASGQSYRAVPPAVAPLTARTVGAGEQIHASIGFTVPSGQRITAILFTTRLGEQLGLWSTS
ncbi:MAG: DUF1942 domain-containing protein [Actinomycetota bacterium]|nr:DUF1942 domain-containing protein [Actinomycetota bacterium]